MAVSSEQLVKRLKNRNSLMDEAGGEGYSTTEPKKEDPPKDQEKDKKVKWDVFEIMRRWGKKK